MDGEPVGSRAKKLTDAGRYWALGSESYSEAVEDLKRFNAPQDVIDEVMSMQKGEDFEVWPENWPAVEMFLRVQTQWRATYGSYYGLDYNVLFNLFDIYDVEDRKGMLDRIRSIEFGIIGALNEEK